MAYPQYKTVVCTPAGGTPEEQGKGIAVRSLMDFGEQLARENECLSVRLDTFSKTPETTAFTKQGSTNAWGKSFCSKRVLIRSTVMRKC